MKLICCTAPQTNDHGNPLRTRLFIRTDTLLSFNCHPQHKARPVLVRAAAPAESSEAAERGERLPRAQRRLRSEGRAQLGLFLRRFEVGRGQRQQQQRQRPPRQSGETAVGPGHFVPQSFCLQLGILVPTPYPSLSLESIAGNGEIIRK